MGANLIWSGATHVDSRNIDVSSSSRTSADATINRVSSCANEGVGVELHRSLYFSTAGFRRFKTDVASGAAGYCRRLAKKKLPIAGELFDGDLQMFNGGDHQGRPHRPEPTSN